jgi:hypothetical protein
MRQLSNFEHLIGRPRRPDAGPQTVRKRRVRGPRQVHTSLVAADIDRLIQRYLAGTPINDLANEFAIHRTTVMQHVQRSGVPRRQHVLADRVDEARHLYEQGWSLAQIGQHFDVHASTVRLALLAADVRMRDSQGRDRDLPRSRSRCSSMRSERVIGYPSTAVSSSGRCNGIGERL